MGNQISYSSDALESGTLTLRVRLPGAEGKGTPVNAYSR